MNKLAMHTKNLVDENIRRVGELFPNALTERKNDTGETEPVIDFDVLKQELSKVIVEGNEERYQFTWPDKKKSMLMANAPISDTLRPCREESVDFDNTENLYIEGDNLNVLKLLQETYLGKVKMIYIDPPYNTGSDTFVYDDEYRMNTTAFTDASGQYDMDQNLLFDMKQNNEGNGRFHTDWLNMMYPRFKLAKDLLTENGVIFVSIDDNEQMNLRKICDEVFGSENFAGVILWKKKTNGNNMGIIPPVHDYIVMYAKSILNISEIGYPLTDDFISKTYSNPDNDPRGAWTTMDLSANHKGPYFSISNPLTGDVFYPPEGRYWVFNENEVKRRIDENRIIFGRSGNTRPTQKVYASERLGGRIRAESWWDSHGLNEDATAETRDLFGKSKLFTHPKPTKLIYNLIKITAVDGDIVLDFFSGSATTAHAVMQLNAEDGGKRKFIMVQLPELTDEKSEAYKAGYKNICEIGKERIRRAGAKIKVEIEQANRQVRLDEEPKQVPDIGFRVLKLDSSNMKDVYYSPEEYTQLDLTTLADNIKEDRTPEDLLFQVMLELGVLLSSPIEASTIAGKQVFRVADNFLIACFDKDITNETVTAIARLKPYYAVFRDSSYANDAVAVNFEQIFAAYSPDTVRRVL